MRERNDRLQDDSFEDDGTWPGENSQKFARLFFSAKLAKLSKEEQKMIDQAQKAKWDEYAIHKAAIDTGLRQGLEKGRNQRNREIAEKMVLKNRPVEEITDITELSEADVLAIKAALGKA